jgi:DNA-binding MarR family transcriptional regulator
LEQLKTSFRKAEDSPGFVLWKTANLLQRLHGQCLKGLKVTPTQFSLLTCLVYLHQDGPVTASRIIQFTGMDKMMVSDLIKTLEQKRLLRRKPHPEDARSSLIEPTSLGRKTTNAAVAKIEALDGEFFRSIKDLERFHKDLITLLKWPGDR